MKMPIGQNIRDFRKKNNWTQEAFAERLGVTYQSVSRWENGAIYPDLELIPAIAEALSVTVDELLGMSQIEKEKRAAKVFDELRRACEKREYDAEYVVALLREIRRNYLNTDSAWRPWCEGNERAFRDPRILPEVRLVAEAALQRQPMSPHVLETMAEIEDEEHLPEFLKRYTTPFDCSERALLFQRYFRRNDKERLSPERRYQLYQAFNKLLCPRYLLTEEADEEQKAATIRFMQSVLSMIRCNAVDERPDMWTAERVELGLSSAAHAVGRAEAALSQLESMVALLEEAMKITDTVLLPTSCRFLDGMEWRAREDWMARDNLPDRPQERILYIETRMPGTCSCHCVISSRYADMLAGTRFEPLRARPEFISLYERVRSLVVVKPQNP